MTGWQIFWLIIILAIIVQFTILVVVGMVTSRHKDNRPQPPTNMPQWRQP